MTKLFLPPTVHYCCRGEEFVFLDVKRDEYVLLDGQCAAALTAISSGNGVESPSYSGAIRELLESGLLTMDQTCGRPIRPTLCERPTEPLIDPDDPPVASISLLDLWRFIAACISAYARIRFGRLEATIAAIVRRKAGQRRNHTIDINRARELTAIFRRLRPLFPRSYVCLYDSLALLEFLGRYRVFPSWVFGVQLEPWAAHCWVQEGSLIFDGEPEEACAYTPIMRV